MMDVTLIQSFGAWIIPFLVVSAAFIWGTVKYYNVLVNRYLPYEIALILLYAAFAAGGLIVSLMYFFFG